VGGGSTSPRALGASRDLLAIVQVAFAITLVVVAGLVIRSFVSLSHSDWGFDPEHLLLVSIKLPREITRDRLERDAYASTLRARLETLPDVRALTVGSTAPIRWQSWAPRPLAVDGIVQDQTAAVWTVGESYFAAAGIPVLEGRPFDGRDRPGGTRAVVISRSLARELFADGRAVGRTLQILEMRPDLPRPDASTLARLRAARRPDPSWFLPVEGASWEVIGVVPDVRMFGLDIQGNPALYVYERQAPAGWVGPTLPELRVLLRTAGGPASIAASAKAAIEAVRPGTTFTEIVAMSDLVSRSIGGRGSNKLLLIVASAFGLMSLGLAALGLHGMAAHTARSRSREIAIRMALGAVGQDVARVVLGHMLRLVVFGLALGVTVAWAGTRLLAPLLFHVSPVDPMTYVTGSLVVVGSIGVAWIAPIRRSLQVDPAALLKA
jgi:putative ABC transport system permease protein